jgi:hypothetical protein
LQPRVVVDSVGKWDRLGRNETDAAPIVGGMITSTIHVLILVPVFFVMMKERALRRNAMHKREELTAI